ncbi:hypothetical protein AB8Z38_14585 [Bradyrhizobium sp. LLZ17]|uniref:Uncharacterized protein n=1 Tax=Bradyrhizobium sp. LLZ17 TaxID=3239388 RepID=A0AB39XSK2_9BRAD
MTKATIADLKGGEALCSRFKDGPSFHDATLQELELRQDISSAPIARIRP